MEPDASVASGRIMRGTKEYRRAILALFFGSLTAFGTEYCVQPIIPVFTQTFGLQPALASLAVSFGTGGMAVAMLLIASFAKRLPRKAVMSVALILPAGLAILMAVSQSFELILLLRLCQGMLLAGFPAMAIAYINEEFDTAIVGAVVGIYVSGTSIGGLAGRLLLSFFTDLFSWRTALGIVGGIYAVIGIAFLLTLPKAKHVVDRNARPSGWREFHRLLKNRRLVALYGISLCIMGAFVCTYNFISYVLLEEPYQLSQTAVGFVYLIYFVGTFSSTVMGRLSDRIGNGKVVVISVACMLAGILVSLLLPLWMKLLGIGIFTYGFFGAHSSACSWAGKLDASDKARIASLYMFFYYVGGSVIGSLGGNFLPSFGWAGIVGFLGCILSLTLCMSVLLLRAEKK
ncbi:MAG: MFS transporter [Selenomonadaceae bacterium]|nr:MFS transporter [Selenomonadaceae bacterium]